MRFDFLSQIDVAYDAVCGDVVGCDPVHGWVPVASKAYRDLADHSEGDDSRPDDVRDTDTTRSRVRGIVVDRSCSASVIAHASAAK